MLPIAVVDLYTSAIWTERYCDVGDFELYMPLDNNYVAYMEIGNYLMIADSDRAMIIDSVQVESSLETGERTLCYKGETLESILKRRIVWGSVNFENKKPEYIIKTLILDNAVHPSNPARTIVNLLYSERWDSATTAYINSLDPIDYQFNGENLYDAVKTICEKAKLGFKIVFNDAGKFVFSLYYGIDRTMEQAGRDAVVFSPEFETLISSRYIDDISNYRNVALVAGERNNDTTTYATTYIGDSEPSDLDRREMYVSASDVKSEENGQSVSPVTYQKMLRERGQSELNDVAVTSVFDGEAETSIGPQFNREYFLGDFVSVINELGFGASAQITEYIRSYDAKGYSAYPTFVMQTQ